MTSHLLSLFSRLLTTRKGVPVASFPLLPPRIGGEEASRMRHPSYDLEHYDAVAGATRMLEGL